MVLLLSTPASKTRQRIRRHRSTGVSYIKLPACSLLLSLVFTGISIAGPVEQAKRIHDRLTGTPPSQQVLEQMTQFIEQSDVHGAANLAMENPAFYNVTLKNWVTPWTNEEGTVFAPLNDYTATVIGMVRDDVDFRQVLSGDILYVGNNTLSIPPYNTSNNQHYQALEDQYVDLSTALERTTQSAASGIDSSATAGVMTTRAAAKAFFKDGTNRAMFRFTLMNHLCTDLEGLKDTSLPPDRIRQDLSRSPGGDSRIFVNSCVGCHSGMDPMAQAFAYYEYEYDVDADPEGENGRLAYNTAGQTDPFTGLRVTKKHWINANNFPFGYVIQDDKWDNYWRQGKNQLLGWSMSLTGSGEGAKSLGEELANSSAFASCQVTKVFENVCLRSPQDQQDRNAIDSMVADFTGNGYRMKGVFASAANYCKGD